MRPWVEKPMHIACTPATFEAYVPPEGDGKQSLASKEVNMSCKEMLFIVIIHLTSCYTII